MKIVDLILRANEKKDGGVSDLMETFDIQSNRARLSREEALKVKDIKEIAFGKYSVQVPCFNLCKFLQHYIKNTYSEFLNFLIFFIVDCFYFSSAL